MAAAETPMPEGSLAPKPDTPQQPESEFPTEPIFATPALAGPLAAVDAFATEHDDWRRELAAIGGRSPLLHFEIGRAHV